MPASAAAVSASPSSRPSSPLPPGRRPGLRQLELGPGFRGGLGLHPRLFPGSCRGFGLDLGLATRRVGRLGLGLRLRLRPGRRLRLRTRLAAGLRRRIGFVGETALKIGDVVVLQLHQPLKVLDEPFRLVQTGIRVGQLPAPGSHLFEGETELGPELAFDLRARRLFASGRDYPKLRPGRVLARLGVPCLLLRDRRCRGRRLLGDGGGPERALGERVSGDGRAEMHLPGIVLAAHLVRRGGLVVDSDALGGGDLEHRPPHAAR